MIELANSGETEGLLQKEIAKNQDLSLKYLDTIISSLKIKGLITNVRGKGSGYVLTRPANEITVFDIYTAFEQIEIVECINNQGFCERSLRDCKANCYWNEFGREFTNLLKSKTLEDIINSTQCECCNDH